MVHPRKQDTPSHEKELPGAEVGELVHAVQDPADFAAAVRIASRPVVLEEEYVPDGGMGAWTVLLGSTSALFASAGMINSYGTFQDYYESTLLPSSASATISLIGSLQVFLLYGAGPITGRIFDAYGTKVLVPVGSFLSVLGVMMLSLAQKDQVYQVFLSQGICLGLGIAILFNPCVAVMSHWFRRKRALAMGIALSGGALSGVLYPIILQRLIPSIGFPWAVRVIGFINLTCLSVACLTVRSRLPLSPGYISWRSAVDLRGFKDPRYVLATTAGFLLFYVLFIPYFYIQIYANFRQVPPNISNVLVSILNALNIPSRILPGLLADRYGCLAVFIPITAFATISVFALWLPSHTPGTIIAFTALYGLFSVIHRASHSPRAFVSLLAAYIASITPREVYGARLGSVYIFVAISTLAGAPTGGALLATVDETHFRTLIIFSGVLLAGGTLALCGAASVPEGARWKRLRSAQSSQHAPGSA
ncbi:monocarboxylate permease [Epithele typhae]|uniref:monocarboxylate permease n=1 Tax=Epithele typhae TaxID=378194 RepID=UPI00200847C6|nr:monocarboxylate permease [Epithele typhae]KAH9912094.1 monocarboxylate permease [Epithele typhae]